MSGAPLKWRLIHHLAEAQGSGCGGTIPKALDIFVAGGFDTADPNALGVEREK